MKKILILSLIGVFLLVLSFPIHYVNAQESPQTPVSGQYTNSDYGISITLPNGWRGMEQKVPQGTFVMISASMKNGPPVIMMYMMMAPKESTPIKAILMPGPFAMTADSGKCDNPVVTTKTVNGVNLSEFVEGCTGDVTSVKMKMDVIQTDKYYISISYMAFPPSAYDSDVAAYDTSIGTLQVTNSIEAPAIPGATQQPTTNTAQSSTPSGSPPSSSQSSGQPSIPSWIKNNAKWWSQNQIGDNDFIKGMQYLISQGILHVPQTASSTSSSQQIPQWIKHTAGWWALGQVSDDDFVKAIQYLISQGIISTGNSSTTNVQPPQHVQPSVNSKITNSIEQSASGSASSGYLHFKRPPGPSSTNYQFITSWNENVTAGDGGNYDPYPRGMATDSSGNVYVTDSQDNLVLKFDNNGKFITSWGYVSDQGWGSCPGQFDVPTGIAIDPSNNVYVFDGDNVRVQKFDTNGNFIKEWGAKYIEYTPPNCEIDKSGSSANGQFRWDAEGGTAVDSSGYVYVVDSGNDRVQKFDSNGNFITTWKITDPVDSNVDFSNGHDFGIAVDQSGNVYLNTDNPDANVVKYSQTTSSCPAGTQLGSYSQNSVATNICFVKSWTTKSDNNGLDGGEGSFIGIAIDSTGNLYVNSGYGDVQKFDGDGNFITSISSGINADGQLNTPDLAGVAVDSSGNVFVIDYNNYKVQKFGPTP